MPLGDEQTMRTLIMNGMKGLTKEVMLLFLAPSPYEGTVESALLRHTAGLTRHQNQTQKPDTET